MVVYSHGSGGQRYVAAFFTEALASQGFVVVAPDHAGNTTLDQVLGSSDDREVVARNRPEDVSFVISTVLDGIAVPDLSEAVDGSRIGVAGHSFGGYTALAVGGGVDEFGVEADERVDALVVMAPAVGFLSDADLGAVDVPTLVMSGTLDDTTPIDPNTVRTAELVTGRPLVRADLVGATHQSFSDACAYTVLLRELPDVPENIIDLVDEQAGDTCGPDVLDVDRAQDLINTYAIAFLESELTGDDEAAELLAADAPDDVELTVER